jgi:class 3 adenylate cyclase/RNA polymerase subunit RPABC4/transcription elongation factor Spt4
MAEHFLMSGAELRQRLAAILAVGVSGYSRLMAADEDATVAALDDARGVFRSRIEPNHGRVIDMAGDSVLAVFETATGAVNTAVAVQTELAARASAVLWHRLSRSLSTFTVVAWISTHTKAGTAGNFIAPRSDFMAPRNDSESADVGVRTGRWRYTRGDASDGIPGPRAMTACSACGFELQPDFAFCPRCGTRLPEACAACGFPCPPDFRFCPKCGSPRGATPAVPASARPSETAALRQEPSPAAEPHVPEQGSADANRRLVTVLFADLSGFTALGARLDPEDVRALQADLFQEMTAAIEGYEGFVEKYVGDAVMAVFGAPVAHEDEPERALRAALAMHERMDALSRRWERRLGQPIALHVGVNTGPVVAGNLGATPGAAYAVTGDTVNTASRLQAAASSGETLVSRATYHLTQHAFAFDPLPDLSVKGKAEPLAVYRLLAAFGGVRSARGLEAHGLAAPLVGRDEEFGQLLAAFGRMLSERAQVVS